MFSAWQAFSTVQRFKFLMVKFLRVLQSGSRLLPKSALLLALAGAFSLPSQAQTYWSWQRLEGYNADLVAEGSGTLRAAASTNNRFDGATSNMVFYARNFRGSQNQNTDPPRGIENSGILESANVQYAFRLAPFAQNNMLLLEEGQSDTLWIRPRTTMNAIRILAASSEGPSTIGVKVKFENGPLVTLSNASIPDWFTNTPPPFALGLGRVSRTSDAMSGGATTTNVFDYGAAIAAANKTQQVDYVILENVNSATFTSRLVAMAVTALHDEPAPTLSISNATATDFTLRWNHQSTNTYYYELATDSLFSQYVAGARGVAVSTGDSVRFTGLATNTQYYVRLRAEVNGGSSGWSAPATVALGTVNLASHLTTNWTLFPNPGNHQLYIRNLEAPATVHVLDLQSRELQVQDLSPAGPMDIQGLPAGTYVLRIQTATASKVLRLLKQ